MFTLSSSSPGGDRDPGGFRRESAVTYRSIYSNRESAASYFPHPGALRGVRSAEALAAAVTQALVAEGTTVIEAVVYSDHYVDTVSD